MLAAVPKNDTTAARETILPIGRKVQALLDQLGQTPSWLAEKVGVSRSTITRILKGERNPTPETLQEIAPVLGLTVAQLASGTDAAERVKDAKDLVARKDYEDAVRKVIEYEARAHDLTTRVRELTTELGDERSRSRRLQKDAEHEVATMREEREEARRKAAQHQEDARRYRDAFEKAVVDVAQLREQVRELGSAVDAGRKTGRIGAILAGVAAAVSVASYLTNDADSEQDEKPKASSANAGKKRKN